MPKNLLNNILNKLKRKSTQGSFNKKSQEQHKYTRNIGSKFVTEKKQSRLFRFLPEIKINPKMIYVPILLIIIGAVLYFLVISIKAWIDFSPRRYQGNITANTFNWQGNSKLTILLIGTDRVDAEHVFIDGLSIYSVDPQSAKATVFTINPDLKVYVSSLGKDVNFRTMLHDKNLSGDRLVIIKNAVSALLAVKIDRYLLIDKADFNSLTQELSPIKVEITKDVKDLDTANLPGKRYVTWSASKDAVVWGNDYLPFLASDVNGRDDQLIRQENALVDFPYQQFSVKSILNLPKILQKAQQVIYTDISKDEFVFLVNEIAKVKEADVKKGYTRSVSYSKINSISFYPIYTPDLGQIDSDINNIFFDMSIFKEQAKVEILNSSSVKGLANNRARWIVNLGARVVKVGNGFSGSKITKIYCDTPEKYPNTIAELQRIFNSKAELIKTDFPNRHVGDIVIELGDVFE